VSEKEVAQAVEGLGAGILKSILSGEGLDWGCVACIATVRVTFV
jgi:hypothetical protein